MPTEQKHLFNVYCRSLSKNDTIALKAFGILLIVLHIFFHSFPGWDIENEFWFSRSNYQFIRNSILRSGFFDALGLLFSYFGHYGVNAFVFLSSYGLYQSYRNKKLQYWQFVKKRVSKLYPAFFLGVLFYLAYNIIATKGFNHPNLYLGSLLRLSLLSNFIPGESFRVVGPWWFYSMIIQFYLIFPLLRRIFDRYGAGALLLLSILSYMIQLLFNNTLVQHGLFLNTTVIGHLPVFALGLVLARENNISMRWWLFVVVSLLFYFGNNSEVGWMFTRVWFVMMMLYVYLLIKKFIPSKTSVPARLISFIGSISMYIFVVNGFLRQPFLQVVLKTNSLGFKLLITFGFVAYVVGAALLLRIAERLYLRITSAGNKTD
jgi:peptidoglycan/LPS O-acetylase OafA/YrhL